MMTLKGFTLASNSCHYSYQQFDCFLLTIWPPRYALFNQKNSTTLIKTLLPPLFLSVLRFPVWCSSTFLLRRFCIHVYRAYLLLLLFYCSLRHLKPTDRRQRKRKPCKCPGKCSSSSWALAHSPW